MFQLSLKKILIITVLLTLSLTTRLIFAYDYLEDWDSVQFAIALHRYSIVDNLPHAPGYPLYILMAKFLNLFFQNDTKSLVYLSVFLGFLCVIPLYLLTKKMFNLKIAFLASLLFTLLPVSWSLSEVALTNIPGQFFLISFIYFLYRAKALKGILLASLFGGFILGVRFTEFPIIALLTLFKVITSRRRLLTLSLSLVFFLVGLFFWLIPLILLNPESFFKGYENIARYIFKHDSLLGQGTLLASFKHRISQFWILSQIGFTKIFIVSLLFSLFFTLKKYLNFKSFQFTVLWLVAYLVPLLTLYNLEVTRYLLPLAAPLAILLAFAIFEIKSKTHIAFIVLLLTASLTFSSVDQLKRFNKTASPTQSAIEYVKSHLNPAETTVVPTLTFRHFQYYASEFSVVTEDQIDHIRFAQTKYYVIDYLPIKARIKELANFEIIESKEFNGDKDIFNRVNKVSIYLLKNNDESKTE